ncbi:hypothetical protein [Rubinisphaera italica]|uniref:Type I restriction modification DNA specificity domain protein n=1 Tax=Rubinisphaera italica TaxID=2527969 RepID=A0A5C5XND1_9PLAN|nr:hypothetical protein [Rubinisphaera italica]TWT64404.1 hypothetical protein Pan54_51660 [Rubinisphaera italica]
MTELSLDQNPIWVPNVEIGANRFDALYYDPTLTVAERHLRAKGPLGWKRLQDVASELYSFGAYELTNQIRFVERGQDTIPYLNVTEVKNPFVHFAGARHIDRASHRLLEKSACSPGTLLLAMSASIGRVGILPATAGACNSNQHLAKVVIDGTQHDPHFLAIYFSSSVGKASCEREAAGAVQKSLYLYNIATLPIPDPSPSLRTAIGHKVRAAELLNARAEVEARRAVEQLDTLFPNPMHRALKPNEDGKCDYFSGFVGNGELGLFHGAQFFAPKRKNAIEFVSTSGVGRRIGTCGSRVREKGKRTSSRKHLDPANVSGVDGYWTTEPDEDGGDVVIAESSQVLFMRMRPYLNKTTINDGSSAVSGSPEFLVYQFASSDSYFAALCLRQPWALSQVAEIATGDRPRVDGEFVDDVLVPWPCDELRHEIGEHYRCSFVLRRRADTLVEQAIEDVERLVQGILDETDTIHAGTALAEEFGLEVPK